MAGRRYLLTCDSTSPKMPLHPDDIPLKPGELPVGVAPAASFAEEFRQRLAAITPEEEAEHERYVAARKAEMDADTRKRALKDWLEACPPLLQETDWTHPALRPQMPRLQRILEWQQGPRGIAVFGRSGKGKSRALWALARRLAVDQLLPIRYLSQGQVMNEVNRDGISSWLEKMDRIRRAPAMIWDDFGNFAAISSRRDFFATELFNLIDYRFHNNLPLLLTSNARESDFAEIFGKTRAEPVFRRIQEGCEIIDLDR